MLKVQTGNIAQARHVDELTRSLRDGWPHIVGLTEAYNARPFLADRFRDYRHLQYLPKHGAEAPGIAVLVRRDLDVVMRWPMKLECDWRGPNGKPHDPRVWPVLRVRKADELWRVLVPHFPSGGPYGPNPVAWAEAWRRANQWIARNPTRTVAAGDLNVYASEIGSTRARLRRGVSFTDGTLVDHALHGRLVDADGHRIPTPEGMHGWIRWRFRDLDNHQLQAEEVTSVGH